MHYFELAGLKFRYLVGPSTVGIITPSRKKFVVRIEEVRDKTSSTDIYRLSAEEVAAYVLKNKLR